MRHVGQAGSMHGFTLTELCVSLAILALVAGFAAPGYRASLRAAAVRSATLELLAGLQQTRANSILESRIGLLCPTGPSGACLEPGVAGAAWGAFLQSGRSPAVRAGQSLPSGVSVRGTRSPLQFWPDTLSSSNGTLTICDEQRVAAPRAIIVSIGGRARLAAADVEDCAA